ncbi:polyprenyl synthetase [Streptomyces sp. AK02-01A]|uniref:polyprenyl synthetase n=1 Tax=Streptomyces sp. AK02-01A TaxID=3028648 RepID=UPI0029A18603|nr:polyprenyl synthetase [Streptomyces sp. AK02-01A]MDX3850761.1 polyprenyl synthetase [Streptomyces sp. AK02-01A]
MSVGDSGSGSDRRTEAAYLAAGLADLAVSGAVSVLRGLRGVLGRSDLTELTQDGGEDLKARGRLALQRYTSLPEAHLELLARRVAARRGPDPGACDG